MGQWVHPNIHPCFFSCFFFFFCDFALHPGWSRKIYHRIISSFHHNIKCAVKLLFLKIKRYCKTFIFDFHEKCMMSKFSIVFFTLLEPYFHVFFQYLLSSLLEWLITTERDCSFTMNYKFLTLL